MSEPTEMVSKAWAKARRAELEERFTLAMNAITTRYTSAFVDANTPGEAQAVAERMRDELLAALGEIETSLTEAQSIGSRRSWR